MLLTVIRSVTRVLVWALAASLLAAAPAAAQTGEPGKPDFDTRSGDRLRPVVPSDEAAIRAGLTTTPTLWVGGRAYPGVPYDELLARLAN